MLTLISLNFLVYFGVVFVVHYLLPPLYRWKWLLVASAIFFILSSGPSMIPYLLFGVGVTFAGAWVIDNKAKTEKYKRVTYVISLALVLGELFLLKYVNFFINTGNWFGEIFHLNLGVAEINLIAPLGISYYTLTAIGYLTDVYWGIASAEKSFLRHALFMCYFPQMTSGPITRYSDMREKLFSGFIFDAQKVWFGLQRMVWGLFKKMVIADRLAIVVRTVYGDTEWYSGLYIVFAALCFAAQLYTDFSGCMDIVYGVSEALGVRLPENFASPFASRSFAEFWRRWHITLGGWVRDYILYPTQKSDIMQRFQSWCKRTFGKAAAKKLGLYLSLLPVWLAVGFWHNADPRFIIISGILPWLYLMLESLLQPSVARILALLKINTECFSFKLFTVIKIVIIMCSLWMFAPVKNIAAFPTLLINLYSEFNPWIFFDGSLLKLGLTIYDYLVLIISLLLVGIVDYFNYRGYEVRELLAKQNLPFRWIAIYTGIFSILVLGIYGPEYDPVDFIYRDF